MKKLLAILLAAIMVIPMFAACKEKPDDKPVEPTEKPADVTEAPAEPTEAPEEPTEAPEEPESDEAFVEGEDGWMVSTGIPVFEGNTEPAGQVIVGTTTEALGDWAYAYNGSNGATDNQTIRMTDDCETVVSNEGGYMLMNPMIVKAYKREEDPETKNVTYTFKINEGLKFNNGDPITAENFLAWTLFTTGPAGQAMGSRSAGYNSIPGGDKFKTGDVNYLEGLRLLDDYTFSMTQLAVGYDGTELLPYYWELAGFGARAINLNYWFGEGWHVKDDGQGAYMVNDDASKAFSKENIEAAFTNAEFALENRVTSGPYNLVKFDKGAGQITLEANPNYPGDFQGRKPGVKTVVILKVAQETVIDFIKTGKVEIYSGITDGVEINQVLDLMDAGELDNLSYCQYDRAGFGYIAFASDLGPAQYKEVRQAAAYLLDRVEFAKTFCEGWGGTVHGPYCTAFQMYKDSEDFLDENLNTYSYDPAKAVECLKAAGFVLNEDGTDFDDANPDGKIRYKEVTEEEAKNYEDFCVTVDGKLLMPAIINWASSEGNSVSDMILTMLANRDSTKQAGMKIVQNQMTFEELLNYMYRQDATGIGGDFSVPKYNMFNLATSYNAALYDESYNWTTDPDYLNQGFNTDRLYDEELDELSMKMVYGVQPGDYETYLDMWQKYIVRWNELVPRIPLYANVYISTYPKTLDAYKEDSFWDYSRAILYSNWVG